MSPHPAGIGVGAEPGVNHRQRRFIIRRLQIRIILAELLHQKHAFVDNRAAGQGSHISVVIALLKHPANHIEAAVKGQTRFQLLRLFHKSLHNTGHTVQRLFSKYAGIYRHHPPAKEDKPLLLNDNLKHLFRLVSGQLILGKEEHAHAVLPLPAQPDTRGLCGAFEKSVGNLQQNPHAVAGFPLGVLSCPVFQILHDFDGVLHGFMGFHAAYIDHRADSAVVMLKPGVV